MAHDSENISSQTHRIHLGQLRQRQERAAALRRARSRAAEAVDDVAWKTFVGDAVEIGRRIEGSEGSARVRTPAG